MNSKEVKVLSDAGLIFPSDSALKVLAYDLIEKFVANPFEYNNENREDLLTLGAIFGVISAVKTISEEVH